MIIFRKVRWKNFLSYGDNWTEVQLDKCKHTLIVGHNGSGKSTMLDALSFALFGRAHRAINNPQLVNSINKKHMLVEAEFDVGKTSYFVRRGHGPRVFQIFVNGQELNQDAHAKDLQKILELNILKLNHKSFHQIVVLGSSSFIPFMQLSQNHRRDVIEDLLDINVFSKMNVLLRERNSALKEAIKDIKHQIELNDGKRESQKRYIRDLSKLNAEYREDKERQIADLQQQIDQWQDQNGGWVKDIEAHKPELEKALAHQEAQREAIISESGQITSEIKNVVKEAKFYEKNDTCPTCHQDIDEDTKDTAISAAKEKARLLAQRKERVEKGFGNVDAEVKRLSESLKAINDLQGKVNSNIASIQGAQRTIGTLEAELNKLVNGSGDLSEAKEELEKIEATREQLVEDKLTKADEYQYNSIMAEMLKDTGIKTKVIKQYLPVINKLVNQYLQVLDFFVSFELDESFSEEIRSRYRDTFTYDSFSEGEKQRIDLALLFTWRQVAKMKNSVATNLLVLDETFDSSLDHDGVENLMKILHTLSDDTNVFVISHKGEILEGKFEKKIEFRKEKNFSQMLA